jgi:Ni/Co efflux regulator RcnB
MKRLALAGLAALTLVGATATPAVAQDYYGRGSDTRGYDARGYDNRGYDNRGYDNRGYDNRNDRDYRDGYRDGMRAGDRNDRVYAWRQGGYVNDYRGRTVIVRDYRSQRLRQPPRGYQYVRNDRGDVVLAAIATGLIVGLIVSSY